ncbi:hypothetical protein H920_19972 [Fukomys damarensis]|uniref:Uncharacterized protein n=1 Tax=Fukomys damarensis TaxID=885580 RepID=A0A091D734_FUKDA|nr:hypothetical protein H920_19972 [Fukomys damarensis]
MVELCEVQLYLPKFRMEERGDLKSTNPDQYGAERGPAPHSRFRAAPGTRRADTAHPARLRSLSLQLAGGDASLAAERRLWGGCPLQVLLPLGDFRFFSPMTPQSAKVSSIPAQHPFSRAPPPFSSDPFFGGPGRWLLGKGRGGAQRHLCRFWWQKEGSRRKLRLGPDENPSIVVLHPHLYPRDRGGPGAGRARPSGPGTHAHLAPPEGTPALSEFGRRSRRASALTPEATGHLACSGSLERRPAGQLMGPKGGRPGCFSAFGKNGGSGFHPRAGPLEPSRFIPAGLPRSSPGMFPSL